MSRLRTLTTFNKRSYDSESEKPNKVFIIAVEGNETEVQYFNGIQKNRSYLGISNIINIEVLERGDTNSAPKHVISLLEEYISEGYTDAFIREFEDKVNSLELGDSVANVIRRYFQDNLSKKDKQDLERLIYEADKDRVYYQYLENWNVESKEFCVVFDKDRNKPWSLIEEIKYCISKGYTVALTNPCFEFWLLLHLCDVKNVYSLEEIKENKRTSNHKKFVDEKLKDILGGYNKVNIRFKDVFLKNIDIAIKREKEYSDKWEDIINNVGSNIGQLIEEMRKK